MTREETRDLLRRHQDAVNRRDIAGIIALYSDDAVLSSPLFGTLRGRAAVEESFRRLFVVMPDYQVHIDESLLVCEGDRATEFSTGQTTHSTELFGFAPTGHRLEWQIVRLFTFRDGLITSERRIYDLGGFLERLQLGRLEQELAIAADIQRTLLSRTEHDGGYFEVVGASIPSRTVGGDFFEYVDMPSGSFGLALGDVSGNGPAAALVAAMLQGILSVEGETGRAPSLVLSRVNKALGRRHIEPRYATLVYGVIGPDGRFSYSNAGQNPPILLTAQGVRRLSVGGPMLGVFDGATFPEETLCLAAGDTIIAFTDGVTDAVGADGEPFGEERLLDAATANRLSLPPDLLNNLLTVVREFCRDTPQGDDITVTVLRYRGPRGATDD